MKKTFFMALMFLVFGAVCSYAQNNDKEPTIEEMAEKHTKDLVRRLGLNESQEFYVDSILVTNYTGVKSALEDLQRSGMQDPENYRHVNESWQQKTLDALKKVLDEKTARGVYAYFHPGTEVV